MYNRFAEKRRRYLREYRDGIYTGMLLTGKLDEHLKEIGDTAQEMFDQLVEQMKKAKVSLSAEDRESNGMGGTDEQHLQPCGGSCPF